MSDIVKRQIAILEDDRIIREHFIEIINSTPDLEVCGVATDIGEVPKLIAGKPDLLLADIGLPGGSGLDVLPAIKASPPSATVTPSLPPWPPARTAICSRTAPQPSFSTGCA